MKTMTTEARDKMIAEIKGANLKAKVICYMVKRFGRVPTEEEMFKFINGAGLLMVLDKGE